MNSPIPSASRPLILLGAGGHAKVLLSLVKKLSLTLLGVAAPEFATQKVVSWRELPVLGAGNELNAFLPEEVALINGVGQRVGYTSRQRIFDQFKAEGYYFPPLIHPQASVDSTAMIEEGVQIMAGAVIQADACIGKNVIINTKVSVDHDCVIEEQVHLAPGVVLCGGVHIGKGAFIGSGAVLTPGIQVGEGAVIGAGASVVRHVKPHQLILPAAVRQMPFCLEAYSGD